MIELNSLPVTGSSLTTAKDSLGSGKAVGGGVDTFAEQLKTALDKVNASQVQANEVTKQFLAGEIQDVHQVMIAMQEARLTMQLAVEVRSKIIEAYQEISRMQV